MTARFPRQSLRFSYRCLALALALLLTFGSVAPVQAQSYGGEYYSGGNTSFGDFGGYGFHPDDNYGGRLIEGNFDGGAGLDLGCGAINIMDYMKATFNVNNLIERAKASMQTMVAKYVMVFLLSQPIIASAMDKLNGMLNFGYDMFNQSCDLNEVQKLAKARYTRECIAEGNSPVDCQEMPDPLKPMMNQAAAVLGQDLQRVLSDPVGSMQATMGCSSSGLDSNGVAQSDACLLMAFAPRVCGTMDFGGNAAGSSFGTNGLNGCNSFDAPISAAGVSGYAMDGAYSITMKNASTWDNIRRSNPRATAADMRIIARNAVAKANASGRKSNGEGYIVGQAKPRTQLAMTNISYVSKMFADEGGSADSEKMLKEYRDSPNGLQGCSEENRTDPLRMVRFVAQAANEHFGGMGGVSIDDNIKFTDAEKVKAEKYFNFDKIPENVRKHMGIDAKSAMTMLEETVSCLANGQAGLDQGTPLTNPLLSYAIATGTPVKVGGEMQTIDWPTASRWMGRPISCKSVNKVFDYLTLKFKNGKEQLEISKDIEVKAGTKVASDGTTTEAPAKKVSTEETKKALIPAMEQVINSFEATLKANERACIGFTSSGITFQ